MFKIECNDCRKPIADDDNHFFIPSIIIVDSKRKGQANNIHLCSKDCLVSWITKSSNRPQIITPNGPAQ